MAYDLQLNLAEGERRIGPLIEEIGPYVFRSGDELTNIVILPERVI